MKNGLYLILILALSCEYEDLNPVRLLSFSGTIKNEYLNSPFQGIRVKLKLYGVDDLNNPIEAADSTLTDEFGTYSFFRKDKHLKFQYYFIQAKKEFYENCSGNSTEAFPFFNFQFSKLIDTLSANVDQKVLCKTGQILLKASKN